VILTDLIDEFLKALSAADTKALSCKRDILLQALPPKERDPLRLYLSDLGKCPRSVAYRLLQTEKDPQSPQSEANDRWMFHLADEVESVVAAALLFHGLLTDYQHPVKIPRENWGGRSDVKTSRETIEVKSVRSNSFNHESPLPPGVVLEHGRDPYINGFGDEVKPKCVMKESYALQGGSYDLFDPMPENVMLYVADRGGANTPQQYRAGAEIQPLIGIQMELMDDVRASLPDIPDKLVRVLNIRDYGKTIKEEPDPRCSYCKYKYACGPDLSKRIWAAKEDGLWGVKKAADKSRLAAFASQAGHDKLMEVLG